MSNGDNNMGGTKMKTGTQKTWRSEFEKEAKEALKNTLIGMLRRQGSDEDAMAADAGDMVAALEYLDSAAARVALVADRMRDAKDR